MENRFGCAGDGGKKVKHGREGIVTQSYAKIPQSYTENLCVALWDLGVTLCNNSPNRGVAPYLLVSFLAPESSEFEITPGISGFAFSVLPL